jgi:transposase
VVFEIEQPNERLRCSDCRNEQVVRKGTVPRVFRTFASANMPVFVLLPVPRVRCDACDHVRQVHIPFAEPRRRCTYAFERNALDLSRRMTIQDVDNHLGVSWDTIKEILSPWARTLRPGCRTSAFNSARTLVKS